METSQKCSQGQDVLKEHYYYHKHMYQIWVLALSFQDLDNYYNFEAQQSVIQLAQIFQTNYTSEYFGKVN